MTDQYYRTETRTLRIPKSCQTHKFKWTLMLLLWFKVWIDNCLLVFQSPHTPKLKLLAIVDMLKVTNHKSVLPWVSAPMSSKGRLILSNRTRLRVQSYLWEHVWPPALTKQHLPLAWWLLLCARCLVLYTQVHLFFCLSLCFVSCSQLPAQLSVIRIFACEDLRSIICSRVRFTSPATYDINLTPRSHARCRWCSFASDKSE